MKKLALILILYVLVAYGTVLAVNVEYYGCEFGYKSMTSFEMTSANHKTGARFSAQYTGTVTTLTAMLQKTASIPYMRVGLQWVNAAGNPNGTYLSYLDFNTFTTGTMVIFDIPDCNITAGTVYAITYEYVNGTIDSLNKLTVMYCDSVSEGHLYAGDQAYIDLEADGRNTINLGVSWDRLLCIGAGNLITMSNSSVFGNVYSATGIYTVQSSSALGQNFTVPYDMTVSGAGVFGRLEVAATKSDLNVTIYDLTASAYVLNESKFCSWRDTAVTTVGTATAWIDGVINPAVDLVAGHIYKIWFTCAASDGYILGYGSAYTGYSGQTWGNATYQLLSGTDRPPSTGNGNADLTLRLLASGAALGGYTEDDLYEYLVIGGIGGLSVGAILAFGLMVFTKRD